MIYFLRELESSNIQAKRIHLFPGQIKKPSLIPETTTKMSQPSQNRSLTEGVFVPRKRLYEEYVFDIRDDTTKASPSTRPKRRGPLTSASRGNIERVKESGGACWRCKMLKKSVGQVQ